MDMALKMQPDATATEAFGLSLNKIENVIAASGINTDFAAPPPPTGDELFDAHALEADWMLNAFIPGDSLAVAAMAIKDHIREAVAMLKYELLTDELYEERWAARKAAKHGLGRCWKGA